MGGFGAEPGQVQQGSGEGSGEARFNRVPGKFPEKVSEVLVQTGSTGFQRRFPEKVWEALVQSQVKFNRVPEKVPESQVRFKRVPEKVPEKVAEKIFIKINGAAVVDTTAADFFKTPCVRISLAQPGLQRNQKRSPPLRSRPGSVQMRACKDVQELEFAKPVETS